MNAMLLRCGQVVGIAGVVLMVVAVLVRLTGNFTLAGFETGSLLLVGIGGVCVGSFCLLWRLAERERL